MRAWTPLAGVMIDDRYARVAWHGGGSQVLKIGKAHIADTHGGRVTLCGRTWRRSQEVEPNDYWTTGACAVCVAALQKESN